MGEICRYMFNEILTAEQRERTHIFNTFFYGQLTKENKHIGSGLRLVILFSYQCNVAVFSNGCLFARITRALKFNEKIIR